MSVTVSDPLGKSTPSFEWKRRVFAEHCCETRIRIASFVPDRLEVFESAVQFDLSGKSEDCSKWVDCTNWSRVEVFEFLGY